MRLIITCLLLLGISITANAFADTGSGSAAPATVAATVTSTIVDQAVAAAPAAPAAPLPPEIHDPVAAPVAALQDVQGAIRDVSKKGGWGLLAFMLVVMITRLGAAYSTRFKVLAFLGKGYVHLTLATLTVFALAAYNALALGGSMYAALGAALGAVLYKLHTLPEIKPGKATADAPSETPAAVA